jgi:undecaprenyl-diphosphatase
MSITDLVSGLRNSGASWLPALIVAAAALGVLAFVYIGHEVGEEELVQFDSSILLAFRDPADLSRTVGPPWLAESVVEITALGGYTLIVVLVAAVIGLLLINGLRGPALFVLLSVTTGWVTSHLLKSFYDRPRPDLVPQLDIVHTASFPSGHAMMTTLVYLTLASVIARLTEKTSVRIYVFAVAVAIALAVGLTRIFLGVHWPSDVIAGWALGAAWAALSWLAVSVLRRRRDRERGRLQSE